MKAIKKFGSLLIAAVMMMAMTITAFAAEPTGTITITNASAGQTYTAYKVFDATYNETTKTTAYSVKAGNIKTAAEGEGSPFNVSQTSDSEGNYAVSLKEDATDEAVLTWLGGINKDLFVKAGEEKLTTGNTVTFDVAYGYYYITSSLGTVVTVNTNTPNVSVIDKNTTNPDIPENGGKKIVSSDGTTKESTAQVGDIVDFEITFTATNFETKDNVTTQITEYTISDTPTNLKIIENSIAVIVDNMTVNPSNKSVDETTGAMTIKLDWDDANGNSIYNSPVTVKVTYSAVVTGEAADSNATNTAKISYNDKEINGGTTETKTYSFTLNKVDSSNQLLNGAQFKLFDAETDGNEIKVVKTEDGSYRVAEATENGVVIEAGSVVVKGLKSGVTYYLEEIKAPDGYNMLTERQPVTIGTENASNIATITNQSGTVLPSTGGMGTTIFYVLGSLLVICAGVVLIARKRMSAMK